jgi:thioredoxin-dependent peroxiredoxin
VIEKGQPAPDFTLPGIEKGVRRDFSLSEYRGRNVVLAFYPGDNTPGCTRQLCSYRDDWSEFEQLGAVLLGISPQSVDSHEKFASKHNFPFPLLADTDKKVAEAYGVTAPIIGIRRSVFVVDGSGTVQYTDRKLIGATFVPTSTLKPVLASLG